MSMVVDSDVQEASSSATNSDTDGSDYDPSLSTSSSVELDSDESPSDSEAREVECILVSSASNTPNSHTPTPPKPEPTNVADARMSSPSPEPNSSSGSSEPSTDTDSDAITHVSETPALGGPELAHSWDRPGEQFEGLDTAFDISVEVEGSLAYEEHSGPFWFVGPQTLVDDGLSTTADSEVSLAARYASWMRQHAVTDFDQQSDFRGSILEEIEQESAMSMRTTSELTGFAEGAVDMEEVFENSLAIQASKETKDAARCDESITDLCIPSLEVELSGSFAPSPRSPSPHEIDESERSPMAESIACVLRLYAHTSIG
jgi:hypothetical protein